MPAVPDKENDPVLVLLAKIRGQIDDVVDLIKEERTVIVKGIQDHATDKR
jgi:ribosomal protein L24